MFDGREADFIDFVGSDTDELSVVLVVVLIGVGVLVVINAWARREVIAASVCC